MRNIIVGSLCGALVATVVISWMADEPTNTVTREIVYVDRPTTSTSSTTTTSTTSTTTTTVAPKPSKSAYIRKLDEYFPGASSQYPVSVLDAGGKMACMMWNAEAGVSRMAVIRETQTAMGVQNMELAAHISQAVLWTLCPSTATFPFGPRETAEWG